VNSGDQVDPACQDGEAALTDLSLRCRLDKTLAMRKMKLKQLCWILK